MDFNQKWHFYMAKWVLTIKNGFRTWGSFEITVLIQRVQETAVIMALCVYLNKHEAFPKLLPGLPSGKLT